MDGSRRDRETTFASRQHRLDLLDALDDLGLHDHLALIYETREEQFDAAVPFVRRGIQENEKCLYVIDDNTRETLFEGFRERGFDVEAAVDDGAFAVADASETYLADGYFDPDEMFDTLSTHVRHAKAEGYDGLRATGEMTWQLDGTGDRPLMEYEATLNDFLAENDCVAICQYNRERFGEEVLRGVVKTHPHLIYRYTVIENPAYVPPDAFRADEAGAEDIGWLLETLLAQEQTREQLADRERQLQVMNRVLTHNLRNDMNVIVGNADDLADVVDADLAAGVDAIRETARNLVSLSNKVSTAEDILGMQYAVEPIDLNALVDRQVRRVAHRYPEASLDVDVPADVTVLATDHLDTAIWELIENAVVHNDRERPHVEVRVSCTQIGAVDVVIADDGPGIPSPEVEVLTGDRSIDPLYHGSGIGLWLADWIVGRCHGSLSFDDREGRGSVVTVTLSQAPDDVR